MLPADLVPLLVQNFASIGQNTEAFIEGNRNFVLFEINTNIIFLRIN